MNRADRAGLLHDGILRVLPTLRGDLHLPAGENGAGEGEVLGDVPPLVLLRGEDGGGPADGARPAGGAHRGGVLDGRHGTQRRCLLPNDGGDAAGSSRVAGAGAGAGSSGDGPEDGHHTRLRAHAGFHAGRRVLRAEGAAVHGLDQVPLHHVPPLPAHPHGPVLPWRDLPLQRRRRLPRRGLPSREGGGTGPQGGLHHRPLRHVLPLQARSLPGPDESWGHPLTP